MPPTETRNGTASSRKLLQVLLAFTEQDHTWTVADLAAKLGMPVSTIYRYVSALKDTGLIEDGGRGGYRLTWLTVGLARAADTKHAARGGVAFPTLKAGFRTASTSSSRSRRPRGPWRPWPSRSETRCAARACS